MSTQTNQHRPQWMIGLDLDVADKLNGELKQGKDLYARLINEDRMAEALVVASLVVDVELLQNLLRSRAATDLDRIQQEVKR